MEAFSDASDSGWGACCNQAETHGHWDRKEAKLHITCRELLAVWYGLKAFPEVFAAKRVLWRTDNTAVVAYLNKMGGTRVRYMNDLALSRFTAIARRPRSSFVVSTSPAKITFAQTNCLVARSIGTIGC
jgi:hypothetical protein